MALKKTIEIVSTTISGDFKNISAKELTIVKDGDNIIAQSTHRSIYKIDQNLEDIPTELHSLCEAIWTDDLKAEWQSKLDEAKVYAEENYGETLNEKSE